MEGLFNARLGVQTPFYLRNEESLKAFKNTQMSILAECPATLILPWFHFLSYKLTVCKDSAYQT